MIPRNNPEKFIERWGNWWYIREFDYLPEPLEYYERNITTEFMNEVAKGTFELFRTKEKALEASYQIRKFRNMNPYSFDEKVMANHLKDILI